MSWTSYCSRLCWTQHFFFFFLVTKVADVMLLSEKSVGQLWLCVVWPTILFEGHGRGILLCKSYCSRRYWTQNFWWPKMPTPWYCQKKRWGVVAAGCCVANLIVRTSRVRGAGGVNSKCKWAVAISGCHALRLSLPMSLPDSPRLVFPVNQMPSIFTIRSLICAPVSISYTITHRVVLDETFYPGRDIQVFLQDGFAKSVPRILSCLAQNIHGLGKSLLVFLSNDHRVSSSTPRLSSNFQDFHPVSCKPFTAAEDQEIPTFWIICLPGITFSTLITLSKHQNIFKSMIYSLIFGWDCGR